MRSLSYDKSIDYTYGSLRSRDEQVERIGKKYQKIYLYRELGNIYDNYKYSPRFRYSDIELVFVNVQIVNDSEYLCAYYVTDTKIDINKLKEDISQELTDYMVPTFFIQLDELPLNPNGKLDRKKLPLPSIEDEITDVVEASNELEQHVLDICREIISKDDFGVTTNLFNIGFTSLTVIQLLARISEELQVDVSIIDMMKSKNILEIVDLINSSDKVSESDDVELKEY